MKKIIKGKLYNSETATLIGERTVGNYNDLNFLFEELYKTKSGLFFIYGGGGANSKYAQCTSANTWAGGEDIIPLSRDDAMEWAEKYLTADEYLLKFGSSVEYV